MDCIVHWATKSRTRPSSFHFHFTVAIQSHLQTPPLISAFCITSAVTYSPEVLSASESSMKVRFSFSPTPVNVDILTSSHSQFTNVLNGI